MAEAIGRGFGTLSSAGAWATARRSALALGRDNRLSSDELAAGVRRGLVAAGLHVVDVGTVPTPVALLRGGAPGD